MTGRRLAPVIRAQEMHTDLTTGQPETSRPPTRSFSAYFVLFLVRRSPIANIATSDRANHESLTPARGAGNHTTSPHAGAL